MFGIIILYLKYEEKPAVTLIQILGPKANRGFVALRNIFFRGDSFRLFKGAWSFS